MNNTTVGLNWYLQQLTSHANSEELHLELEFRIYNRLAATDYEPSCQRDNLADEPAHEICTTIGKDGNTGPGLFSMFRQS